MLMASCYAKNLCRSFSLPKFSGLEKWNSHAVWTGAGWSRHSWFETTCLELLKEERWLPAEINNLSGCHTYCRDRVRIWDLVITVAPCETSKIVDLPLLCQICQELPHGFKSTKDPNFKSWKTHLVFQKIWVTSSIIKWVKSRAEITKLPLTFVIATGFDKRIYSRSWIWRKWVRNPGKELSFPLVLEDISCCIKSKPPTTPQIRRNFLFLSNVRSGKTAER